MHSKNDATLALHWSGGLSEKRVTYQMTLMNENNTQVNFYFDLFHFV